MMNSSSLPKGDKVHALRKNSKLLFSLEELLVLVMQCYPVLPKEKYTCAFNSPLDKDDYQATLKEKIIKLSNMTIMKIPTDLWKSIWNSRICSHFTKYQVVTVGLNSYKSSFLQLLLNLSLLHFWLGC